MNPQVTMWHRGRVAVVLAAVAVALVGCNGDGDGDSSDGLVVAKARCGPNDRPEPDLQGQVSAATRAAGFKGYSCNLELIGQTKGDGGSWQHAFFQDKAGRHCSYYDSASFTANRLQPGVTVVDTSNAGNPIMTTYLNTTAMLDPWESLKVNERRQMLGGVNALNGNGGPEIELYDLSGDCRFPQLLTDAKVGLEDGSGQYVAAVRGHEGNFSPDGLTYYAANLGSGYIYPIDITNPTKPKLLTQYFTAPGRVHGLNIRDDGNRAYVAILGRGGADTRREPGSPPNNGLLILDTSDIQARKPDPELRVISAITWDDGGGAQHAIDVSIKGKRYVIHADEAGSGMSNQGGWEAACAAGLTPWPVARIIDISDETNPKIVSKLTLEAYDTKHCDKVLPDLAGLSGFTYGAHYCSVDNRLNATTLACGYFNSGIRVFDIRDPAKPKEIAYYNPAGTTTASSGSNHVRNGGWVAGGPDWCTSQVRLDVATGTLQTMCQDNGFLSLKFTNGVWPFPESTTPPGLQN